MADTLGDKLGRLSVIVTVPWDWREVKLLCFSCGRRDITGGFEKHQLGPTLRRDELIQQGTMVLRFGRRSDEPANATRIGLLLSFDQLLRDQRSIGEHLLHEVRPSIDNRWYGEPVGVQDVSAFTKTPLVDMPTFCASEKYP